MIDTLYQVKDKAVICPFIIWFVSRISRITQKLYDRFLQNVDRRWITAQNRPC